MSSTPPVPSSTAWERFWFTPADPVGLHAVRVAAGVLFLAWLLPLAGHRNALFGLTGWFDRQAFAATAALPDGPPKPLGWSAAYLGGGGPEAVTAVYAAAIVAIGLFTLGVWPRLTGVLTWVAVASFTANPALDVDADAILTVLAFYLMVGYVLVGQRSAGRSWSARLLGGRHPGPSVGAGIALRLLQVHLAVLLVTSGLHKLQFGDWWAGVALWYPLYPPLYTTLDQARTHVRQPEQYLMQLNVAAYTTLAWQIGFPLFAWRRSGWWAVVGGAVAGWVGVAVVYGMSLYGAALFVGCLAFVPPEVWRRLLDYASRFRPGQGRVGVRSPALPEGAK